MVFSIAREKEQPRPPAPPVFPTGRTGRKPGATRKAVKFVSWRAI